MHNERYQDSWGFWGKNHTQWYLLRCFKCDPDGRGLENHGSMVAEGQCGWCGYKPMQEDYEQMCKSNKLTLDFLMPKAKDYPMTDDGISLTCSLHPIGNPVPIDADINPESGDERNE